MIPKHYVRWTYNVSATMFALVAMNSISKRTECMDTLILDDKFCLVFAYLCVLSLMKNSSCCKLLQVCNSNYSNNTNTS